MKPERPETRSLANPWRKPLPAFWCLAAAGCVMGLVFTLAWREARINSVAPLALSWMIGGFFGLVALCGEAYARQADRHLAAFARGDYVAHWTYTPEEWDWFLGSAHAVLPWRMQPKWTQAPGEAYIGRGAVYFNGLFETWTSFGLYLSHVKLLPGPHAVLELMFTAIRSPSRWLRIPVPEGKEAEAKHVVDVLSRYATEQ